MRDHVKVDGRALWDKCSIAPKYTQLECGKLAGVRTVIALCTLGIWEEQVKDTVAMHSGDCVLPAFRMTQNLASLHEAVCSQSHLVLKRAGQ